MESKKEDAVILVLRELLDEIKPLSEQLEMMIDDKAGAGEDVAIFKEQQLEAIKKKRKKIQELLGMIDSIEKAHYSGGRRTKRRRNKKKRKTKKKRRKRRRKK
uniref:Uncharacterized protein n=1 Tax=viral metagenome TaxID=1070528 RepID=A0A6C0KAQ8_9ZZZZ